MAFELLESQHLNPRPSVMLGMAGALLPFTGAMLIHCHGGKLCLTDAHFACLSKYCILLLIVGTAQKS